MSAFPIASVRVINNGDYGWRSLRLLARRSPYFFAAAQKIPNSLPDYLDTILKKVAGDIPVGPQAPEGWG